MAPKVTPFKSMMFLLTEAHLWSSAKSCRRKLHSLSLVLLLLSNPLLHCSRSKPPSQRHFFHQLFRRVAEGAESSTPPSHQGSSSHYEVNSLTLGDQWDSTAVLSFSQQESLFGSLEKFSQTYLKLKTNTVETLFPENNRYLQRQNFYLPTCTGMYLRQSICQNFASQTETEETPSLPATMSSSMTKAIKSQKTSQNLDHLW